MCVSSAARAMDDPESARASHRSTASSREASPFRMSPPPQTFDAPLSNEQKRSLGLMESSLRFMPGSVDSERYITTITPSPSPSRHLHHHPTISITVPSSPSPSHYHHPTITIPPSPSPSHHLHHHPIISITIPPSP